MRPTVILASILAAVASCLPIYPSTTASTASTASTTFLCPCGRDHCSSKPIIPTDVEVLTVIDRKKCLRPIQPILYPRPPRRQNTLSEAVQELYPDGHRNSNGCDPPSTPVGSTPKMRKPKSDLAKRIRARLKRWWRALMDFLAECWRGPTHAEGCSRKNCEGLNYNHRGVGHCPQA